MKADIPIGVALRQARRREAAAFAWHAAASAFGRGGRWLTPDTLRLVAGLTAIARDRRPLDFEKSTKALGARVELRLRDGRVLHKSVSIPRGFAGAHPAEAGGETNRDLMWAKFTAAAAPVIGVEPAATVAGLIAKIESLSPAGVVQLFEGACIRLAERASGCAATG
jgi:hypothetical protein